MKRFTTLFALLLFTIATHHLGAQPSLSTVQFSRVPALTLPAQDNASLLEAELEARKMGRADKFAVALTTDVRPTTHGHWTTENGTAVWRLRVHSPGAKTLNLGFSEYNLPAGAELFLLTPEEKYGPFTSADNEDHNQLWTPLLNGDELVVELRVDPALEKRVQLYLTAVNHDFVDVTKSLSGSCNLDVACGADNGHPLVDDYRDIIRSVAAITVNGVNTCSGFLVNNVNQDGTPLFMTANHCGVTNNAAAAGVVAYWNYENSFCRPIGSTASGSNGNGSRNVFNSGARHLASNSFSDFTLLLLDDPVTPQADAFFAGWDATETVPSANLIAVHHPGVEEKRISFSFEQGFRVDLNSNPTSNGSLIQVPQWTIGTTEGGSSGSPLFDEDKRVRGQLFRGAASCNNPTGDDEYGYFATSWDAGNSPSNRLVDWLDPCGTGTLIIDGLEYDDALRSLSAISNCQEICSGGTTPIAITAGSGFPAGTTLSVSSAPDVLTATLSTTTVNGGESFDLNVATPADLTAGTYTIVVTASSAAGNDDIELLLEVVGGVAAAPALQAPGNNATGVDPVPTLTWAAVAEVEAYDLEIATDAGFSDAVYLVRDYPDTRLDVPTPLTANVTYFWRVRSVNTCGPGEWSTFSFTTGNTSCAVESATNLPVNINAAGTPTVTSTITSTTVGGVTDMEVTLFINHTYVGDLSATLTSPDGITINLFDRVGNGNCGGSNMEVTFSDAATMTAADFTDACTANQVSTTGTFQPAESFAGFVDADVTGNWTLRLRDNANEDGGQIVRFDISFCGEGVTGVQDFGEDRTISVYPNPVRNRLTVEAAGSWPGDLKAGLFDTAGRFVSAYRLNRVGRSTLDVSGLAAGVYYLRVDGAGHQRTERIVILP